MPLVDPLRALCSLAWSLVILSVGACERPREAWEEQLEAPDRFDRWLAAVALAEQESDLPAPASRELVEGLLDRSARVRECSRRSLQRRPIAALTALGAELLEQAHSPVDHSARVISEFFGYAGDESAVLDPLRARGLVEAWRESEVGRALGARVPRTKAFAVAVGGLLGSSTEVVGFVAAWCALDVAPDRSELERALAFVRAQPPSDEGNGPAQERARAVAVRAALQHGLEGGWRSGALADPWLYDPRHARGLIDGLCRPPGLYPIAALRCLAHIAQAPPSETALAAWQRDPSLAALRRLIGAPRAPSRMLALLEAARLGPRALPLWRWVQLARGDRHLGVRCLAWLASRRIAEGVAARGTPFR